jgi:hypothetical protein
MRALDPVERHPMRSPSFFQHHAARVDAGDAPGEGALPLDRLGRHDLCQPSREAAIVRFSAQRPIDARRRHFQRVLVAELLPPELVFDVE